MPQSVVLGVDSSTQSTKVIAVDLDSGEVAGEGRAPHSGLDIQDPAEWWDALVAATRAAVSPDMRVEAISVGGQQHGMVTLDANNGVIRPAPLWNNVDAAPDAVRIRCFAATGCASHEDDPPVDDELHARRGAGNRWEWIAG